jgi:hypothetical protein
MTKDRLLLENSIERVINTTLQILESVDDQYLPLYLQEYLDINIQDWRSLKSATVEVWNDARNEAYKRAQNVKI